jgi:hypothetical protein
MAARQYTKCIEPGDFQDLGFTYLAAAGIVATAVAAVTAAVLSGFFVAVVVAAIAAVVVLITFLLWWLYGRLICLDDEQQCIIGVALGQPSVSALKKAGDNDASFNVALAPSTVDIFAPKDPNSPDIYSTRLPEPKEHYWDNPLQGHIVRPNPIVPRGYVSDVGHVRYLKAIHSEFEGSGIRDLLIWANAVLALLILALALSGIPGMGLFLALLALLLSLLSAFAGLSGGLDPGDPQDVDPNLGEIVAGQIFVIKGNWIYDSLHDGWNEIHAIHACQKIGTMELDGKTWPSQIEAPPEFGGMLSLATLPEVERAIGVWCLAIRQAEDAEGGGSRSDPAQDWAVHPQVDGCTSVIIT